MARVHIPKAHPFVINLCTGAGGEPSGAIVSVFTTKIFIEGSILDSEILRSAQNDNVKGSA